MKFPEVPVVLAHLGMGDDANHFRTFGLMQSAVMSGNANLFADVSWLSPGVIVWLLQNADEEMLSRLLWGSDIPLGPFGDPAYYALRVSEVKTAVYESFPDDVAEELIHRLFFQNAYDLYFDGRPE